ncbi:cell cycle progression protein 1 isoform X1 [Hippocampus zosterae]|uniref:cell cycle progression protein 1 isoform X1 n=1 Tax=Hippocampus zosterae TaxID=109293 RepID=UPI00223D5FA9|nr:cell cycle progression protein 1 isoform X1 [Hippocampus zosterae]XP_051920094.1 cell cycle progression protein 1 isoform X1 [Hippocampus zosterae]
MSNTSSDTESSCGWSIISMEGSDIETLVADITGQPVADAQEGSALVEPELQDSQDSTSASACNDDKDGSLDDTLGDQTMDNTLCTSEGRADDHAVEDRVAVLSFSDHSDIVTLQELKEDECDGAEEALVPDEGSFLGMSCSSQYAFTAATDPGLRLSDWEIAQSLVNMGCRLLRSWLARGRAFSVFPGQPPPAAPNSSSSDDETAPNLALRRRRLRRNTANAATESCEEEEETTVESEEEDEKQQLEQTAVGPATPRARYQGGGTLNSCILLTLVIALSMGFGHFYGSVQRQERQKTADKVRESELDSVRDVLHDHVKSDGVSLDDWDEQQLVSLLTQVIKKMSNENMELNAMQEFVQVQLDAQALLARQREVENLALTTMNHQLQNSLGQEEKSLSTLQDELRSLRSRIRDLEATAATDDALLSENRRLKAELEGEKELRKKFKKERELTYEAEAQELRSGLRELEERLVFEQQRSDMWERLYLETKDNQAKGDMDPKVMKAKVRTSGIVKETFDAVKNSTKEFVHHHKEQIKKAKESVKENLRKFSDSVKSTFRHFKDSASTFFDKMMREDTKYYEARKYKKKKDHPKQDANTRKPGDKVHKEQGQSANLKGCRGVFDCAYRESTSVFNKATEPIRADEFHQLLWSYLQREVHHFHHWKELESFINGFFHNGLFIHDRMLFTDFVSSVEHYLVNMPEYHGLHDDVFGDVDDFIYRHLFGDAYAKSDGPSLESPSGPLERPDSDSREELRTKHQSRRQQRQKLRHQGERRNRHMSDVKIELEPMPLDRKYCSE